MRKEKNVEINGIMFELQKSIEDSTHFYKGAVYDEIDTLYSRPSQWKREIWHDWCDWAFEFNCGIEISSHTCMTFSITGKCEVNGKYYRLWITKDHNRAYPIITD